MTRTSFRLTFAVCLPAATLLLLGCSGGGPSGGGNADGEYPPINGEDGPSGTDAGSKTSRDDDSHGQTRTIDPPDIIRPTEHEGAARAVAREMTIAALVDALGDPKMSLVAAEELAERGEEAVPPLIDALDHNDETIRQRAIFTLGQLGPAARDALPRLKELAETGDTEVVQDSAKFAIDAIEGE